MIGIKESNHKFIKIEEKKRDILKSSLPERVIIIFNALKLESICGSAYRPEMT